MSGQNSDVLTQKEWRQRRNHELQELYEDPQSDLPMFLPFDIKQDPNGQTTASVPVRWCITPELMTELEMRSWGKPYVVFVIRSVIDIEVAGNSVQDYRDTDMQFVALEKEMTYLHFTRPGANQICAFVVNVRGWKDSKKLSQLRSDYVGSSYSCLNERGTRKYMDEFPSFALMAGKVLNVEVPREFFAKEPPAWAKQVVKIFFRGKEEDQCHFGRRMIVSLPMASMVIPFVTVTKFLALVVGLLLGLRKMEPKTVLHPFDLRPIAPINYVDRPIWWYKQDGTARNPLVWPWNPPMFLLVFSIVFTLKVNDVLPDVSLGMLVLLSLLWLLAIDLIFLLCLAAILVLGLCLSVFGKQSSSKQATSERQKAKRAAERAERMQRLNAMVCSAGSVKTVSLEALPKEKQTIGLRFSELKTKVCRPYAR